MENFKTIVKRVKACQVIHFTTVAGKMIEGKSAYWIVEHRDGKREVMDDATFKANYERA